MSDQIRKRALVGFKHGAGDRRQATSPFTALTCWFLLAEEAIHVGCRPAKVGNNAFPFGKCGAFDYLPGYGIYGTALNCFSLVYAQPAEIAPAQAAAHNNKRIFDLFVR